MKGGVGMEKTLFFETVVTEYELMNPEFTRATINIFHKGQNRNGSDITEECMHKMEQTLLGVPVIGEYLVEKDQIGGHGGKVVITDDGYEFVQTTECMGFVDPRVKPFYKDYVEKDGMTVNTYMCASVILWTGRFGFLQKELEKGLKQSMEIAVTNADYDSETGYYIIKDARFQALCLLGEGVEPCFSASEVKIGFSAEDDGYKAMIDAFKNYTLGELGGETVAEEVKEVVETEIEPVEVQAEVEEVVEVEEPVQAEVEVQEEVQEEVETVVESEPTEEVVEEMEIAEEPVVEVQAEVIEEEVVEEVVEVAEEPVVEEVVEDIIEVVEEDYQAKCQELELALAEATRELEAMKAEYSRLVEFEAEVLSQQRKEQEEALFAQFEALEGFDGFVELKANAGQHSIEELELKLFALLGKKNFSLTNKPKKQGAVKLAIAPQAEETKRAVHYGGRFDKYLK